MAHHHHYCPTILENPCEESKLQSHRNHDEEPNTRPMPTLELYNHTLESECTSIDKADLFEPSRSISLLEQLRRDASNQKQCNLPRQIKSIFSCDSQEERFSRKVQPTQQEDSGDNLTKKQYDAIMAGKTLKYDLPRSDRCPLQGFQQKPEPEQAKTHKSLKESIYERLMQAKREKQRKTIETKRNHQNVKQATFRPTKANIKATNHNSGNDGQAPSLNTVCKIKELIKNKLMNSNPPQPPAKLNLPKPCAEFFLNIDMMAEEEEVSPPRTRPNYLTRYQNILKENINSANCNVTKTKRNCYKPDLTESQAKQESFMRSLKLRESLMQPLQSQQRPNSNKPAEARVSSTRQAYPLTKNRSMTTLTFEERQQRTVASKNDKIVKHSLEKQKDELKGCTFRPQLTPYRGFPVQMQRWNSYAQLHKRKTNNRPY